MPNSGNRFGSRDFWKTLYRVVTQAMCQIIRAERIAHVPLNRTSIPLRFIAFRLLAFGDFFPSFQNAEKEIFQYLDRNALGSGQEMAIYKRVLIILKEGTALICLTGT